jgi:hypothetical protein
LGRTKILISRVGFELLDWLYEDTPNICLMSESDDEDSDSANVGDERDFLEKKKRGRPHFATRIRQVRRKESGKKRDKNRKFEISQTGFRHIQS